jgi:hypothetical protein
MRLKAVAVAVLMAASSFSCPRSAPTPAAERVERDNAQARLAGELDACEARLGEGNVAPAQDGSPDAGAPTVEVKTRTKVVRVARVCADDPPSIAPVDSTECQPGLICLDGKAQAALARNLATYEAWVRRVIDCESR